MALYVCLYVTSRCSIKMEDGSSWFLARRLLSTHPTFLHCVIRKFWYLQKIRVQGYCPLELELARLFHVCIGSTCCTELGCNIYRPNCKLLYFIPVMVKYSEAVLANGHTGHVPRAPDFFLFEGPQLAVVK